MSKNIVSASNEEFNAFINEWTQHLEGIHLPPDINTQIGTQILSELDSAYAVLRVHYAHIESIKDRTDSLIRQKERAEATGSNEQARRQNATKYLEEYKLESGDLIDMYDYQRMINRRWFLVRSLIDIINNKQQRLITMTGLIKIDSSLGLGVGESI